MKYLQIKRIQIGLTAAVMILAGVCYSCSRFGDGKGAAADGGGSGVVVLSSEPGEAAEKPDLEREDRKPEMQAENDRAAGQTAGENPGQETQPKEEPVPEPAICFVHVCGAVAAPGVYRLSEGSRIYQAVELAGGFSEEADQRCLNLAAPVSDGMKVTVLTRQEAETAGADYGRNPASSGSLAETGISKEKVNINTAGAEALMTLRGIGEARAGDIIAYRKKHGPFEKIEDIMQVPGIKDAAFQKIKEDITV